MTVTFQELQALVGKDIEFLPGIEAYVDSVDTGMRATTESMITPKIIPMYGCIRWIVFMGLSEEYH